MPRLFLAIVSLISLASFAVSAETPLHWYHIVIATGNTTAGFTGSSPLDPAQLTNTIHNRDFVSLENQRDVVAKAGEHELRMQSVNEGETLYLSGPAVLYFSELPKDPAVPKK